MELNWARRALGDLERLKGVRQGPPHVDAPPQAANPADIRLLHTPIWR
jgi:hypothetical protein